MTTVPSVTLKSGRGWAYTGAVLGGAVSIAANIAHSYVPPAGAPDGWQPQTGAVVGAVFWPAALFVAVEILARTAWPAGRRWWAVRFGGLVPVALVAAVVSYRHLSGLLAFYGEDSLTATIGPLAVDGLMVMATGALLATAPHRMPAVAPAPVAEPVSQPTPEPELPAELLARATEAARQYLADTGRPISRDALQRVLHVRNELANRLVRPARAAAAQPVNGKHVPELAATVAAS